MVLKFLASQEMASGSILAFLLSSKSKTSKIQFSRGGARDGKKLCTSITKLSQFSNLLLEACFFVFNSFQLVRVTVDKCRGAPIRKGRGAGAMEDRSSCSSAARLKNDKYK